MKIFRRKISIFLTVIVCLLLIFLPMFFSSLTDAQSQPEKELPQEDQVKIHGDNSITIKPTDSFHPRQYYMAVNATHQPVQLKYNTIDTTKPGRYLLNLSAKSNGDHDRRSVLIIVEEPMEETTNAHDSVKHQTTPTPEKSSEQMTEPQVNVPHSTETIEGKVETTPESAPQPSVAQQAAETVNEGTPTVPEVVPPAPDPEPAVQQPPASQPNQLSFHGQSIPYQNGGLGSGQGIINGGSIAATWGGNPTQSGSDNQNTHFIGHNPGIFSPILSLGPGNVIIVTDHNGQAATYIVNGVVQVDDSGIDIHSGQDYWGQITSVGGGERITLQTCITDSVNLIVFAQG